MTRLQSRDSVPALPPLEDAITRHVRYSLGKEWADVTKHDLLQALSLAVRDRMVEQMLETERRYRQAGAKRLYYLSMEFLMGRSLANNLTNLGLKAQARDVLAKHGFDLNDLEEAERDAALGNGGLGRLAACFLDSLATLNLPGFGYGINYEYGLFRQEIDDGYQKEQPDNWLAHGTPWEVQRADECCLVPLFGRVEDGVDRDGNYNPMWLDWQVLVGVPFDMPVVGYGGKTVNYMRLYAARASSDFDMHIFNEGDYLKAVEQKMKSETVSKVLYPSDSIESGRELRLIQEYFLVACSLRDIVRRYQKTHTTFQDFPNQVAIQLNDTHPSLTVAELMRLLIDENNLPWEEAWAITQATCGYTNHTLMPEALEKIPVALFEHILPRHLQIIFEINRRFLEQVAAAWPSDAGKLRWMSLIDEGPPKQVRMANLALVGSHSINGVAALHSELVKSQLFPDFYALWPKRFNNKTNGVTQRRWLLESNPALAGLLTEAVGDEWITDLDHLRKLEPLAEREAFRAQFSQIKRANKERLARIIKDQAHVLADPDSLFDVQVKRIHEYKRQLLNALHIIHQYLSLVEDGADLPHPKTYVFAGKAAPGYWAAKQIIKLVNNLGRVINRDPRVRERIKVVFIPDYRVTLAEAVIPAADLSEQISTAGKEASGTSNMKFAMNGALTIGTLDGANVEILQEVGADNIFIFGLKAEEVQRLRRDGSYRPRDYYQRSPLIHRVLDALRGDRFCPREPGLFRWIYENLLDHGDEYFHLADLEAYVTAQAQAARAYVDRAGWAKKAILNVARMGLFSSDRTIKEYARDVWGLRPVC
jgi:starch phosphorylase